MTLSPGAVGALERITGVGATVSEIAVIYKVSVAKARDLVAALPPIVQGAARYYPLRLISLGNEREEALVEQMLRRAKPGDLPPKLTREYWNAEAARLRVEEARSDLWRTQQVVDTVTEAFVSVRMQILLFGDLVARETELTDRQRAIIKQLSFELLEEIRIRLRDNFSGKAPRPAGRREAVTEGRNADEAGGADQDGRELGPAALQQADDGDQRGGEYAGVEDL
jgi:hypothetical protein